MDDYLEEALCTICLDSNMTHQLISYDYSCSHSFCEFCANKILETDKKCPLCRVEVFKVVRNLAAVSLYSQAKEMEDRLKSLKENEEKLKVKNEELEKNIAQYKDKEDRDNETEKKLLESIKLQEESKRKEMELQMEIKKLKRELEQQLKKERKKEKVVSPEKLETTTLLTNNDSPSSKFTNVVNGMYIKAGRWFSRIFMKEEYTILEKRGSRKDSKVYLAIDTKNNDSIVALKEVTNSPLIIEPSTNGQELDYGELYTKHKQYFDSFKEAFILNNINDPHILEFYRLLYNIKDNRIYMLSPKYDYDLEYFSFSKPVYFEEIRYIMTTLLRTIKFLHDNDIVHLDIKPTSVLLDDDEVKLCSFRKANILSILEKSKITHMRDKDEFIYDLCYLPPELSFKKYRKYTKDDFDWKKCDIWGLGCILSTLLLQGRNIFRSVSKYSYDPENEHILDIIRIKELYPSENSIFHKLIKEDKENFNEEYIAKVELIDVMNERIKFKRQHGFFGNEDETEKEKCLDLLKGLLKLDPKERLTCQEAIEHPFIQNCYSNFKSSKDGYFDRSKFDNYERNLVKFVLEGL